MKKLLLLSLICVVTIFCTGCTKTSCDIEINNQNEITIANTQGVKLQNTLLPKGFYEILEKDMNKLAQKYSNENNNLRTFVNEYSAGVITSKDKLAFDKATEFLPKGYSAVNNQAFEVKDGIFKTTYKINMIYNPEVASKYVPEYYEEFKTKSETVEKFGNKIISFASENILVDNSSSSILTIKIPTKAKKHNATMIISDKEYRWDFTEAKKPVTINLEYSKYHFFPWQK